MSIVWNEIFCSWLKLHSGRVALDSRWLKPWIIVSQLRHKLQANEIHSLFDLNSKPFLFRQISCFRLFEAWRRFLIKYTSESPIFWAIFWCCKWGGFFFTPREYRSYTMFVRPFSYLFKNFTIEPLLELRLTGT